MLKYILLASAMTVAAPALAQSQPSTDQAAPAPQTTAAPAAPVTNDPAQTAPTAPADTPSTTMAAPAGTAPAASGMTAQTDPAAPATQTDPTAAATQTADQSAVPAVQPVSKADQVATVVAKEFPSYDKDSNGTLSETEFASWMVALKTASDPSTKASDPATKTWITGAFASADKDKSKSVSKTELTGFLSQG